MAFLWYGHVTLQGMGRTAEAAAATESVTADASTESVTAAVMTAAAEGGYGVRDGCSAFSAEANALEDLGELQEAGFDSQKHSPPKAYVVEDVPVQA